MNKFNNYIYLSICEISVKLFEKSNFTTYTGYCASMKTSLTLREFSGREVADLEAIGDYLKLLYNLENHEIGMYLDDYFNSDKISEFHKCVQLIDEYFPMSHD
jgi:hypothetical protein